MSDGDLRTCPSCERAYAMLHICERCGNCDALDLPRDADRPAPCCLSDGTCIEHDWRHSAPLSKGPKHVTEQLWVPELREDGVYLIGADDRSVVLKLCRPDHGSDLLIADYILGLQMAATGLAPWPTKSPISDEELQEIAHLDAEIEALEAEIGLRIALREVTRTGRGYPPADETCD